MDTVDIFVRYLKAIFCSGFLRRPNYQKRKNFSKGIQTVGKILEVAFKGDEVIVGSTPRNDPDRPGFFIYPANPKGIAQECLSAPKGYAKSLNFRHYWEGETHSPGSIFFNIPSSSCILKALDKK